MLSLSAVALASVTSRHAWCSIAGSICPRRPVPATQPAAAAVTFTLKTVTPVLEQVGTRRVLVVGAAAIVQLGNMDANRRQGSMGLLQYHTHA